MILQTSMSNNILSLHDTSSPASSKVFYRDRGSVSNGHYVTTMRGGSRESRQHNTKRLSRSRLYRIASIGSLVHLATWVVCNYSVLHGPLGQFRWPYTGRAVRQWRILLARKKHPFKPREHLPGPLMTNSTHRRISLFFRRAFACKRLHLPAPSSLFSPLHLPLLSSLYFISLQSPRRFRF